LGHRLGQRLDHHGEILRISQDPLEVREPATDPPVPVRHFGIRCAPGHDLRNTWRSDNHDLHAQPTPFTATGSARPDAH
jgi:hypothetical protein